IQRTKFGDDGTGGRVRRNDACSLADSRARPAARALGRSDRFARCGRRRQRRPQRASCAGAQRLSPGYGNEPDFRRYAARPARPDRGATVGGCPRAGRRGDGKEGAGQRARRSRRRRVWCRSRQHAPRDAIHAAVPVMTRNPHGPLRVGIGGPVGSGKTALMDALCKKLRDRYEIAAITNDIYTKWDAEYLVRSGALAAERIAGVETGGCPHTAIREDASINLAAVAEMRKKFPGLDLV